MVRILELISDTDSVRVKATLDGEDKTPYGWIVPQTNLVPIRYWGTKLECPIFEYRILTLLKK